MSKSLQEIFNGKNIRIQDKYANTYIEEEGISE